MFSVLLHPCGFLDSEKWKQKIDKEGKQRGEDGNRFQSERTRGKRKGNRWKSNGTDGKEMEPDNQMEEKQVEGEWEQVQEEGNQM